MIPWQDWRRHGLILGVLVCALVSPVGCAGGHKAGSAPPGDSAGLIASASPSSDDLALPIDTYGATLLQSQQIGLARTLLVGVCMRQGGFQFDAGAAVDQAKQAQAIVLIDDGVYGDKRRYGVVDLAAAKKYGYHLPSVVEKRQVEGGSNPHGLQAGVKGDAAARAALSSCTSQANAKISLAGQGGRADLVRKIAADSYQRSLVDPTVVAAFASWSKCMATRGFTVSDPQHIDIGADASAPTPTAHEIDMAVADVTCKQQTRLVQAWYGFELKYQNAQIQQHQEELQEDKSEAAASLKQAATIIARGG